MDPATLTLLTHIAQAAKAIATATVSGPVRRLTLHRRIAFATARQAKRRGINVRSRDILTWLKSDTTKAQLNEHTTESMQGAESALAAVVHARTSEQAANAALVVLQLVLATWLTKLEPSTAVTQSYEWLNADLAHGFSQIKAALETSRMQILDRLDASQDFEANLAFMAPWRRDQAITLNHTWQTIEQVVAQLRATTDRAALLTQWSDHLPDWLEPAPADAWAWLGLAAIDYGCSPAGAAFLDHAVQLGVFPRGHYIARIAMCLSEPDPQVALDYLTSHPDDDPLRTGIEHLLQDQVFEAVAALQTWEPESAEHLALRGTLLARTMEQDNPNGAIATALEVWSKHNGSAAALIAARLLLIRASSGGSASKAVDTQQAAELAIGARNARRIWGGDSAEAVEVAVSAAHISHDPERAWALTQLPPEGEATASETADKRVAEHAALTAALLGDTDRARQLVAAVGDPFHHAEVVAVIAERSADAPAALASWTAAWQAAGSDGQRLQAASGIASNGGPLPEMTDIELRHPEAVAEIRLMAEVLAAVDPLVALRANVTRSRRLLVELAKRYDETGLDREAGEALEDGAKRWDEPELMAMAASSYHRADLLPSAKRAAETALILGGPKWPGRRRLLALLVEIEARSENWAGATFAARQLIEADPDDIDAEWALVRCQVAAADFDGAWATLTTSGAPLQPRAQDEAVVWLQLNARYSTDPRFLGNALSLMRSWPDDPDLLGAFLMLAYTGVRRDELQPSPEELAELHRVTADYTQRYPDSTVFRAQQMGPDDDPLLPFAPDLQRQYEETREITEQVTSGRLPLAALGTAAGRTWAEASLKRAAGVVYASELPTPDHERVAVLAAAHSPTVIDPTTAHTLALLDSALQNDLTGYPESLVTTDYLFKDALQARDSLSLRSTLSVGWDPARQQAIPVAISDATANTLAERARAVAEVLGRCTRHPHPELHHFPGADRRMRWLSGIDLAKERRWIYWSDDRVMRQYANSIGVSTFGTTTLLHHIATAGSIESTHLEVARAELIRNYYVDFEFNEATFTFAATADQWGARGAALALSRPSAWAQPHAAAEFALSAIGHVAATAPEEVTGWTQAASSALIGIAGDEEAAAVNLEVLLRRASTQSWFAPAVLPFVLAGIRAAIRHGDRTPAREPLPRLLTDIHRLAVERSGHAAAAELIIRLVSATEEDDRSLAARTILTAKY